MKKIIFRLMVVFLGQLCCLAIGLSSGALNVSNLPVKTRPEQAALDPQRTTAQHTGEAYPFAGPRLREGFVVEHDQARSRIEANDPCDRSPSDHSVNRIDLGNTGHF